MKIIRPSVEILAITSDILKTIEKAGRTCYKSESKITRDSAKKFIKGIIKRGHESVIEHGVITIKLVCDRGVTHEIVRHRLGSYSQESTRYVSYKDGITVIEPCFWRREDARKNGKYKYITWRSAMLQAEENYRTLIKSGAKPEEARSVLPNSLKAEIVITYNLREWRHFLKIRCDSHSHPQIREVAFMILEEFKKKIPVIFNDLKNEKE